MIIQAKAAPGPVNPNAAEQQALAAESSAPVDSDTFVFVSREACPLCHFPAGHADACKMREVDNMMRLDEQAKVVCGGRVGVFWSFVCCGFAHAITRTRTHAYTRNHTHTRSP